jgi:transposase
MSKPRKHYTAVEKVAILRRHVVERISVSDICDQYHVQPSMFCNWQKQFFENGTAAFEHTRTLSEKEQEWTIAALREKLQRKNKIVAELMEEHVKLRKEIGEL